jgi:tripartite-type tricarboxylate transporter receptor subunit TctC
VVLPAFPAQTVPSFISYAKAHPGKINMGSPGIGSSPHMAGELFKFMAGIDMAHVPYRGSAPVIIDLLAGQIDCYFAPISASIEYIKSGKLHALAVTTAKRAQALPNIPTIGEFLPGYEATAFYGVGVPENTPADIVERLNKEINAGLADTTLQVRFAQLGSVPSPDSPSAFGTFLVQETEKWRKVVKFAGIKPE